MLWAFLSVLAGFGDAVSYSMMKKLGNLDTYSKLLVYNLITLPLLLFGFLFYDVPVVDSNFYIIVLVNVSVLLTALFLIHTRFGSAENWPPLINEEEYDEKN